MQFNDSKRKEPRPGNKKFRVKKLIPIQTKTYNWLDLKNIFIFILELPNSYQMFMPVILILKCPVN